MKNIKKQKGIILFTSLIIILLLSLVVYGGLYNIQVTERTGSISGVNADKTHQMAELALLSIEERMFESKQPIMSPCFASTSGHDMCKLTKGDLQLISLENPGNFIIFDAGVDEKNAETSIFVHTTYLGDSKLLEIGSPGSEYSLYRITVVAVFGDGRSALESLIAVPVP